RLSVLFLKYPKNMNILTTRSKLSNLRKHRISSKKNSTKTRTVTTRACTFSNRKNVRSTPITMKPHFAKGITCQPKPQHRSKTAPVCTPVKARALSTCSSATVKTVSKNMNKYNSRQNDSSVNHSS